MKPPVLIVLILFLTQSCKDPKPRLRDKIRKDLTATQLLFENDCFSCHRLYSKSIGPAYLDVAEKYKNDEGNAGYLAGKIINGGGGIWGGAVMSGHPFLTDEESNRLVEWILSVGEWKEKRSGNKLVPKTREETHGRRSLQMTFSSTKVEHILFFLEGEGQADILLDGELIIGSETSGREAVYGSTVGRHSLELRVDSDLIVNFKLYWMRESMAQLELIGMDH